MCAAVSPPTSPSFGFANFECGNCSEKKKKTKNKKEKVYIQSR